MIEIYQSGYLEGVERANNVKHILDQFSIPDFSSFFGKKIKTFETVIISDLHLGSKVSRTTALLDFLERVSFKRLIINGDVFDSINMKRLNRHHWRVLSVLRRLTDKENHIEVVWVRGNHDGYSDLLTQLLGIQFYNEYEFVWNNKKVLIFHGDIFDKFTSKHPKISDFADWIYRCSLRIDPKKMRIGHWLKRNSKTFIRNVQKVQDGAIKYAKNKSADIVICGHTHHVQDEIVDGIRYLNPGSWTDTPSYFIGLSENVIVNTPFS
jgi:UDP-2,3-diacylglucosamine pyrophosphatase LpxH